MRIVVNGKTFEVGEGASLGDWLRDREIEPRSVVVERNGVVVPRDEVAGTPLSDGDVIEVVRFVGGG